MYEGTVSFFLLGLWLQTAECVEQCLNTTLTRKQGEIKYLPPPVDTRVSIECTWEFTFPRANKEFLLITKFLYLNAYEGDDRIILADGDALEKQTVFMGGDPLCIKYVLENELTDCLQHLSSLYCTPEAIRFMQSPIRMSISTLPRMESAPGLFYYTQFEMSYVFVFCPESGDQINLQSEDGEVLLDQGVVNSTFNIVLFFGGLTALLLVIIGLLGVKIWLDGKDIDAVKQGGGVVHENLQQTIAVGEESGFDGSYTASSYGDDGAYNEQHVTFQDQAIDNEWENTAGIDDFDPGIIGGDGYEIGSEDGSRRSSTRGIDLENPYPIEEMGISEYDGPSELAWEKPLQDSLSDTGRRTSRRATSIAGSALGRQSQFNGPGRASRGGSAEFEAIGEVSDGSHSDTGIRRSSRRASSIAGSVHERESQFNEPGRASHGSSAEYESTDEVFDGIPSKTGSRRTSRRATSIAGSAFGRQSQFNDPGRASRNWSADFQPTGGLFDISPSDIGSRRSSRRATSIAGYANESKPQINERRKSNYGVPTQYEKLGEGIPGSPCEKGCRVVMERMRNPSFGGPLEFRALDEDIDGSPSETGSRRSSRRASSVVGNVLASPSNAGSKRFSRLGSTATGVTFADLDNEKVSEEEDILASPSETGSKRSSRHGSSPFGVTFLNPEEENARESIDSSLYKAGNVANGSLSRAGSVGSNVYGSPSQAGRTASIASRNFSQTGRTGSVAYGSPSYASRTGSIASRNTFQTGRPSRAGSVGSNVYGRPSKAGRTGSIASRNFSQIGRPSRAGSVGSNVYGRTSQAGRTGSIASRNFSQTGRTGSVAYGSPSQAGRTGSIASRNFSQTGKKGSVASRLARRLSSVTSGTPFRAGSIGSRGSSKSGSRKLSDGTFLSITETHNDPAEAGRKGSTSYRNTFGLNSDSDSESSLDEFNQRGKRKTSKRLSRNSSYYTVDGDDYHGMMDRVSSGKPSNEIQATYVVRHHDISWSFSSKGLDNFSRVLDASYVTQPRDFNGDSKKKQISFGKSPSTPLYGSTSEATSDSSGFLTAQDSSEVKDSATNYNTLASAVVCMTMFLMLCLVNASKQLEGTKSQNQGKTTRTQKVKAIAGPAAAHVNPSLKDVLQATPSSKISSLSSNSNARRRSSHLQESETTESSSSSVIDFRPNPSQVHHNPTITGRRSLLQELGKAVERRKSRARESLMKLISKTKFSRPNFHKDH